MSQLLDLVENKLLESNILPFLSWNDLLRCRRACKDIKVSVDDFIRLNPQKAPEIEVTVQRGKNLKAFIAMGVSTKKLFLKNSNGHHFYDDLDTATLTKFTTTYGPMITSLRVEQLSLYPCFNEWTFLEALINLKTFEAEGYGLGVTSSIDQRMTIELNYLTRARTDPRFPRIPRSGFEVFTYPDNFKNLEVLKIAQNEQYRIGNIYNRFDLFLNNLSKLDYISFPFSSVADEGIQVGHQDLSDYFGKIMCKIINTNNAGNTGGRHVKHFDFINYHKERGMKIEVIDELVDDQSFRFLIFTCIANGVMLLNVNPVWYHLRSQIRLLSSSTIYGKQAVSLVNLHACVFPLPMPNLEKITICQTSRSNVSPNARPGWPALKTVEINVNSKKAWETEMPNQDTAMLFKCLWKNVVRGQLTELSLKFEDGKGKDEVAIPNTEDIVSGCPNLKKLRIVNWPGKQKALISLWRGLAGFEEVALEYCRDVGNVAFVGEDVENPVFFQLKNLKKLTLKGLDQMPKITDTLVALVLAKMKLSHFIIGSDKPLEKITKVGITALLEGQFAETIEKFPFQGWSLASMSAQDFQGIAQRFRSFNML